MPHTDPSFPFFAVCNSRCTPRRTRFRRHHGSRSGFIRSHRGQRPANSTRARTISPPRKRPRHLTRPRKQRRRPRQRQHQKLRPRLPPKTRPQRQRPLRTNRRSQLLRPPAETQPLPAASPSVPARTSQPAHAAEPNEISEDEIKSLLVGKQLFLRGGYLDNDLSYNENGVLVSHSPQGSYTLSAIQIDKVHLAKHKLELEGERFGLHFLGALPYEDPTAAVDRVNITPKKKVVKITIDRELVVKLKEKREKPEKEKPEKGKPANPAPKAATAPAPATPATNSALRGLRRHRSPSRRPGRNGRCPCRRAPRRC